MKQGTMQHEAMGLDFFLQTYGRMWSKIWGQERFDKSGCTTLNCLNPPSLFESPTPYCLQTEGFLRR